MYALPLGGADELASTLAINDGFSNTAWYSSKEGANDPELVVTFES